MPENKPKREPPIMVISLIKLAWGLTLNLSADESQQKTGELINERLGKLTESTGFDDHDKLYFNEVMAYLSAFLRNMGYEKDFLVRELDINQDIRDEEIKSINDLADLTSLSNEGLISRIVAFFFGGASIFPLIERFFKLNDDTPPKLEVVEKTVETVEKTGESTTTETLLSKIPPDAPQEFAVPDEILIFLVGGGIGIFVLTIVIKLVKSWWIKNKILRKTIDDQQFHWKNHVRKEFIRLMLGFYYDIKFITKKYYPDSKEYEEKDVIKFIDDLLPIEELYVHTGSKSLKEKLHDAAMNYERRIH